MLEWDEDGCDGDCENCENVGCDWYIDPEDEDDDWLDDEDED